MNLIKVGVFDRKTDFKSYFLRIASIKKDFENKKAKID